MSIPTEEFLLQKGLISLNEASAYLHTSSRRLGRAIQEGRVPFAFAVRSDSGTWSYTIPAPRVICWKHATDLGGGGLFANG